MAECRASDQTNDKQPVARVLIYGAGWVGRQIAAQMASHGIEAFLTDLDDTITAQAIDWAKEHIVARVRDGTWSASLAEGFENRLAALSIQSWQGSSFDVVLECVHEQISTKRRVLKSISEQTESSTIIASNSSYFVPSMLAKYVRFPERFAHWHFHVPVWIATISDIVACESTNPDVLDRLAVLSKMMGQRPLMLTKENPGYVFNWLLQSVLTSSLELVDRQVASPEQIDLSWTTITGMPIGPFGMMDQIGIDVIHQVLSNARWIDQTGKLDRLMLLLEPLLKRGDLGVKSGRGFFDYKYEDGKRTNKT